MVLALALLAVPASHSEAATQCQVTYGGGEICQGQTFLLKTYPAPVVAQDPTPTPMQTFPQAHRLPNTGPTLIGYMLIIAAAVGGIAIHLFLL